MLVWSISLGKILWSSTLAVFQAFWCCWYHQSFLRTCQTLQILLDHILATLVKYLSNAKRIPDTIHFICVCCLEVTWECRTPDQLTCFQSVVKIQFISNPVVNKDKNHKMMWRIRKSSSTEADWSLTLRSDIIMTFKLHNQTVNLVPFNCGIEER